MSDLSLNPLFLLAAKNILHEEFTVDRLTETYLSLDGCRHSKKKSARQFIYRNMLRLIKNGGLEKIVGDNNWPAYKFTKKFKVHLMPSEESSSTKVRDKLPSTREIKLQLEGRLKILKLEMLTAMGEAEEYSSLEIEVPGVKSTAHKLADESRDRCSKLLGKVKAIETLLNA